MLNENVLTPDSASSAEQFEGITQESELQERVIETPSLEDVVCEIRSDAGTDPILYLVRSNTFCDGE